MVKETHVAAAAYHQTLKYLAKLPLKISCRNFELNTEYR
jgi:hypothetical protein